MLEEESDSKKLQKTKRDRVKELQKNDAKENKKMAERVKRGRG